MLLRQASQQKTSNSQRCCTAAHSRKPGAWKKCARYLAGRITNLFSPRVCKSHYVRPYSGQTVVNSDLGSKIWPPLHYADVYQNLIIRSIICISIRTMSCDFTATKLALDFLSILCAFCIHVLSCSSFFKSTLYHLCIVAIYLLFWKTYSYNTVFQLNLTTEIIAKTLTVFWLHVSLFIKYIPQIHRCF